jgi:hypothetical protein
MALAKRRKKMLANNRNQTSSGNKPSQARRDANERALLCDARERLRKSDQKEREGADLMLQRTVAKFTYQLWHIFRAWRNSHVPDTARFWRLSWVDGLWTFYLQ